MPKKGTPEYAKWLEEYRRKRQKKAEEPSEPRAKKILADEPAHPKSKVAEPFMFSKEEMGAELLPKGSKFMVHSKHQDKDLEVEVIRYRPSAGKYLVHRADGKYLYYSRDDMKPIQKEEKPKEVVEIKTPVMGGKQDSVSIVPENSQDAKIEKFVAPVTFDMMSHGMHIDKDLIKAKREEINSRLLDSKKKLFDLVGEEFNYKNPKEAATVLYDKLNLSQIEGRSTSKDVLSKLAEQTGSEVPELISYCRSQDKLITSYLDKFERLANLGDGNVRNVFSPSTVSGRFATSYNPIAVEVDNSVKTENKVYFKEDLHEIGLDDVCPIR